MILCRHHGPRHLCHICSDKSDRPEGGTFVRGRYYKIGLNGRVFAWDIDEWVSSDMVTVKEIQRQMRVDEK